MRTLFLAILTTLTVLFTAGGAWAQGHDECGVNWAPRGSFVVPSDLEVAAQNATRLGEVHWRETPGQSRAPLSCAGSNDPRCQVEQADPPARGGSLGALGGDAVTLSGFELDVPPSFATQIEYGAVELPGPMPGFSNELLRPPSV